MKYSIEFKPRAVKAIRDIDVADALRKFEKLSGKD